MYKFFPYFNACKSIIATPYLSNFSPKLSMRTYSFINTIGLFLGAALLFFGCATRVVPSASVTQVPLLKRDTVPVKIIDLPRTEIAELPVLKNDLDRYQEQDSQEIETLRDVTVATDYNYGRSRDLPIQLGSVDLAVCIFNIPAYLIALDKASGFEYEVGNFDGEDDHGPSDHIDSVKLYWPDRRDSVVLYFQAEVEGDFYFPAGMGIVEETIPPLISSTGQLYPPDEYGDDLRDYGSLPEFDINNTPISIWFLKEGADYTGFLIGGHAEAKVCEVASLEVFSKMTELDPEGAGVFSFGVGYHQRSSAISRERYNQLLEEMQETFSNLEQEYPYQVSVNEIDERQYERYTTMLADHVKKAVDFDIWDTHIVEYKLVNHPLMLPFRKVSNGEIIRFDVPADRFGKIPTELAYSSMAKDLTGLEEELNEMIAYNRKQIEQVKGLVVTNEEYYWEFDWAGMERNLIETREEGLLGHEPPPDGFVMTDRLGSTRPITLREAMAAMNNSTVEITADALKLLKDWKNNADEYLKGFTERKYAMVQKIEKDTKGLSEFRQQIRQRKTELTNRKFDGHVIDAFLRGWVFGTGSDELDEQLDSWYATRRTQVWQSIMGSYPDLQVAGKLAGIFEVDDVFFAVQNQGQTIRITPYKLTGGEFLQVIDKAKDVSYAVSPFNYRFKVVEEK